MLIEMFVSLAQQIKSNLLILINTDICAVIVVVIFYGKFFLSFPICQDKEFSLNRFF